MLLLYKHCDPFSEGTHFPDQKTQSGSLKYRKRTSMRFLPGNVCPFNFCPKIFPFIKHPKFNFAAALTKFTCFKFPDLPINVLSPAPVAQASFGHFSTRSIVRCSNLAPSFCFLPWGCWLFGFSPPAAVKTPTSRLPRAPTTPGCSAPCSTNSRA